MNVSGQQLGRGPTERGMPTALLECLAAMRIGAETALDIEFVAYTEESDARTESHE